MTGCQYKETFLFLVFFFFFTIGATKSHTPNHESLFQSRQRDGRDTDLLAWNSLRREPDESMMSGTRAGTAALKNCGDLPTAVFDTSSSMWRKRLICLSFVLKLVSRQKMILGWSSPLSYSNDFFMLCASRSVSLHSLSLSLSRSLILDCACTCLPVCRTTGNI